jgi:hypothetical protein
LHISPLELRRLAGDVDDMHHEAMRDFAAQSADLHADIAQAARATRAEARAARQASRRRFLTQAGTAGAAGVVWSVAGPGLGLAQLFPAAAQDGPTDTQIAGFAQSVELAAVEIYKGAAALLSAEVKPVGALFQSHHQQHADAFGAVAGDDASPEPNPGLLEALGPTLSGLTDEKAALTFARQVENQATYTYAYALTALQDKAFASATATILPIEAQHATVISIALGEVDAESLFPTDAFEAAVVGDGTDPVAGIDPAAFPAA